MNVRQRNEETFHHRNAGSQRWNRTGIAHSRAGGSRGRAPYQHAELDNVPWIHECATFLPFRCDWHDLKLPPFRDDQDETTCDYPWHSLSGSNWLSICLLVLHTGTWIYGMNTAEHVMDVNRP